MKTSVLILTLITVLIQCSSEKDSNTLSEQQAIQFLDLSQEKYRQIIVDKKEGQYMGQPNTVLLEDNKTIIVGYPEGHGHPYTIIKRSTDGGLTWSDRLETPENFLEDHYAPTLHRLVDQDGKERINLMVVHPVAKQSHSEDNGLTWSPFKRLYENHSGIGGAPPMSMIQIRDSAGSPIPGNYFAFYHVRGDRIGLQDLVILRIRTTNGGLNWTLPEVIGNYADFPNAHPCEPGVIRSPDGKNLLCLMRENSRTYQSLYMVSEDEGFSWSDMKSLPSVLTGDRHNLIYAPDGRLVVTFRDLKRKVIETEEGTMDFEKGPYHGDFVAWIGTYDDILNGKEGQYKVRLIDNWGKPGDTGYSGIELLPDGTIVSTTYASLNDGEPPVVVSVRYRAEELDELAEIQSGR